MLTRRQILRAAAAALPLAPWLPALAADAANDPARRRSCILLWMNGGPSTIDLFDPKPGNANGGPFKAINTATPGLQFSEHLPELAKWSDKLAVVRSMSTKEGDHGRAAFLMRTGNLPLGPIHYPTLGALVAKELGDADAELPAHVSVVPPATSNGTPFVTGAGFLGPRYAPLLVGEAALGADAGSDDRLNVPNLKPPADVSDEQRLARLDLLRQADAAFAAARPGIVTSGHQAAYDRAARLMRPSAARAFKLSEEPPTVRERYGPTLFGQGCLLARRLVEHGVPFVEVSLDGWDSHANNFDTVARLGRVVDAGWSALMADLHDRGLLATTTVVWMGEFGRTPRINSGAGRDHYPAAWSAVLAGGGIRGGQAFGGTSPDGTTVEGRPVTTPDLLATLCKALGMNPRKQNDSNVGRPIRIVEKDARPVTEVLA